MLDEKYFKHRKEILGEIVRHLNEVIKNLKVLKDESARVQLYSYAAQAVGMQRDMIKLRDRFNIFILNKDIYMKSGIKYQELGDEIFAEGKKWEHRTLQTLFDEQSKEYQFTDSNDKLEIIFKILDSGYPFELVITGYKNYFKEQGKPLVAKRFETGLKTLIQTSPRLKGIDSFYLDSVD